ncbi:alpha/beta fold hydrolase [Blastomonas fulva]|uniref:alpha/beta fold hydrolase n=1 Tax=Blastomonas fulva TaxID=1550728 RepID=UPI003F6E4E02
MSDAADALTVAQGFLTIGLRQMHYRRVGKGPAALFIHSSPANSSFVVGDMMAQAHRFTCIAFDTPGFGLSDPLSLETMTVAHLADALAEAMTCIGLDGPVPVFGTHTGAAIALELGYRHPDKVACLALDGVPIFSPEEIAAFDEGGYFNELAVDPLGGHYSAMWTRFRDQSIWFPWYARSPGALNDYDAATPENTHRWTEMFYAAASHYKPAYRAAIGYGDAAVTAAAGLKVPAAFMATTTDMLLPHLERLPPLADPISIADIGSGTAGKYRATGDIFIRHCRGVSLALPAPNMPSAKTICRQIVMQGERPLMVRYTGNATLPVVVVLHDAPGSSQRLEARMRALAKQHYVIAPDIPGSGGSPGLPPPADMPDYAVAIWRALDALGIGTVVLEGHGLGASLALEMAAVRPDSTMSVTVDGVLLADDEERTSLSEQLAPPIRIEPDGAHWYRLWLRLRDSLIYWPWYRPQLDALLRTQADLGAETLHRWTTEVMNQHATSHHFVQAALRHDAATALRRCPVSVHRLEQPHSPLAAAWGDRLDSLIRDLVPERLTTP